MAEIISEIDEKADMRNIEGLASGHLSPWQLGPRDDIYRIIFYISDELSRACVV